MISKGSIDILIIQCYKMLNWVFSQSKRSLFSVFTLKIKSADVSVISLNDKLGKLASIELYTSQDDLVHYTTE